MNWQHCHNMAFVGLSDSWEQYYQAIRRCWRFGQKHPVKVHVVVANTEGAVVANIQRKEKEAGKMMAQLVTHMNGDYIHRKDDKRYVGIEKVKIPGFLKKEK
jgi:biotin synthase-related radical SAM superfamily protein